MRARQSRHRPLAPLLGAWAAAEPSPGQAAYIICCDTTTFVARVSCETACRKASGFWARHEEAWAGCGREGPDCGTSWGEWGHYTVVGPDPCPQGCWRNETVDNEFRNLSEGAKQQRDLWQCQGVDRQINDKRAGKTR